jgi:hypothetical protein
VKSSREWPRLQVWNRSAMVNENLGGGSCWSRARGDDWRARVARSLPHGPAPRVDGHARRDPEGQVRYARNRSTPTAIPESLGSDPWDAIGSSARTQSGWPVGNHTRRGPTQGESESKIFRVIRFQRDEGRRAQAASGGLLHTRASVASGLVVVGRRRPGDGAGRRAIRCGSTPTTPASTSRMRCAG